MSRRVQWFGILAALGSVGFVWDWTSAPLGDSLTWHMCTGEFTSGQESEITDAANSWDAGSGEVLRGAIWNFIRGSDRTGANCNDANLENEVYQEPGSWFTARGLSSSTIAVCQCSTAWHDVVFRSSVSWTTSLPNNDGSSTSIGQTALHEFGHSLGLNHEDDLIATMNTAYPLGGDLSGVGYRPHEDDYVGLVTNRPDSSTGRNLMLGKFISDGAGSATEAWTSFAGNNYCDTTDSSSTRPGKILAVIEGTASQTTDIDWWLSADTDCDAGTKYQVASMSVTIGSNTPFDVRPSSFNFTGVPEGSYTLCAMIDPDDTISESTTASDNDVKSDALLWVEDC